MVEFPDTEIGEVYARAFRKTHKEFSRRKLKRVLQAYPEKIVCGAVYPLT